MVRSPDWNPSVLGPFQWASIKETEHLMPHSDLMARGVKSRKRLQFKSRMQKEWRKAYNSLFFNALPRGTHKPRFDPPSANTEPRSPLLLSPWETVAEHGFVPRDRLFNQTSTTPRGYLYVVEPRVTRKLLTNILSLPPLPTIFTLYPSSVLVLSVAVVQHRVELTHKFS